MNNSPTVRYIKNYFDEIEIAAVMARLIYDSSDSIEEADLPVLAAIRRAIPALEESTTAQIGDYLSGMTDEQLAGMVSNVKGVLHELEFVAIENSDGDQIYASLFAETNHQDYDVSILDKASGEFYDLQLKATNSESYVQDWIDDHPDGEIIVTDEIASQMGIAGSGTTNEDLTTRTAEFVDYLQQADSTDEIWSYLPGLTVLSVCVAIVELWSRYKAGQIDLEKLNTMAAKITAQKSIKIGLLTCALAIPVLNVAVSTALVGKLVFGIQDIVEKGGDKVDSYRLALESS